MASPDRWLFGRNDFNLSSPVEFHRSCAKLPSYSCRFVVSPMEILPHKKLHPLSSARYDTSAGLNDICGL
jgi:hypothetical protein